MPDWEGEGSSATFLLHNRHAKSVLFPLENLAKRRKSGNGHVVLERSEAYDGRESLNFDSLPLAEFLIWLGKQGSNTIRFLLIAIRSHQNGEPS